MYLGTAFASAISPLPSSAQDMFAILSWDRHGANHGYTFKPIEEDPKKIIASLKQGPRVSLSLSVYFCLSLHPSPSAHAPLSSANAGLFFELASSCPLSASACVAVCLGHRWPMQLSHCLGLFLAPCVRLCVCVCRVPCLCLSVSLLQCTDVLRHAGTPMDVAASCTINPFNGHNHCTGPGFGNAVAR